MNEPTPEDLARHLAADLTRALTPLPTITYPSSAAPDVLSYAMDAAGGWPVAIRRALAAEAFKKWVHDYLDAQGVPHHPPGPHGAEGCRIGDRMDWLMDRLRDAEARNTRTYCAYCGHEEAVDGDGALIAQHIRTCAKHPMRAVEAERDRLLGVNGKLREALENYLSSVNEDTAYPCNDDHGGIWINCQGSLVQELATVAEEALEQAS